MTHTDLIPSRRGWLALSPMIVFLTLYVAVSAMIGDFYKMPIAVALTAASAWGIGVVMRGGLSDRIGVFSRAAGHSDILYMIWIFVLAGAFASMAKEIGAVDATVALTLRVFPPQLLLPGMFLAACFISLSVGTSVGTVVALAPLAAEMAGAAGAPTAMYVAAVIGGAFFGDNLSFISDTTIAATRTQGCRMDEKFRANIRIVAPAALVSFIAYVFIGSDFTTAMPGLSPAAATPWLIAPYLLIIALAVAGINVAIVLSAGIAATFALGLAGGHDALTLCGYMGAGIDSMGNLIIITLMAAGLLGVIKSAGGIDYLLQRLTARISGARGAQACVAALVGIVNLCTANNTVAIITTGAISRDIAHTYGITPRKTASLLDTASCIVQALIPYGAQTLLATALAGISPAAPWPYMVYPWALAVSVGISVAWVRKKREK
ncbi:Na+/H+ antiporter NhaC family protein [Paramuribaculum intestinale]|uniref:Na+/H+ antiporter NhaC family protein n=1 Tax=Paramuribaculum intestinale TaxID=2094151 RepID=UPI000D1F82E2|nr:Na+/H+ antiporter NhaC family protein [Paramuribaculum intestinale]MBJ2185102.1 Na+/H+ antiporter NhaC family protein [Muribaculaceae bacterium]ROS93205.1 Na+/H+ antiporter NhaC family protein [Muribaculaceae bacterium Isolate-043 (Harlan)]MCX4329249.1 Na+/H+ antiporter NhaC family protein [Paramuribaculum intestinale]PWB11045.1 sodium:proton antiporter [Paramuribaculum intestinale]WLT41240.1 Na+/H+ antiporter NhaC family protein [Paramuribaculum intestinale]